MSNKSQKSREVSNESRLKAATETKNTITNADSSQNEIDRPNKALKIVKHLPKTQDELLSREIHTLVNSKKNRRLNVDTENLENEALNRVHNHQKLIKDRIKKAQNDASEYSELETVKQNN